MNSTRSSLPNRTPMLGVFALCVWGLCSACSPSSSSHPSSPVVQLSVPPGASVSADEDLDARSSGVAPVAREVDCDDIHHDRLSFPRPRTLDRFMSIRTEGEWVPEHAKCIQQEWLTGQLSLHDINDADLLSEVLGRATNVTELRVVPLNDEHLLLIGALRNLKRLVFLAPQVSDVGPMLHVRQRERIQKLSPSGFARLAALSKLEFFSSDSPLADADLARFSMLSKLQTLNFPIKRRADFTPVGAAHLGAITSLRSLSIVVTDEPPVETVLTDAHLAKLEGLRTLEYLAGLGKVTDAGLASLAKLPNLTITELNLSGMNVSDAGLASLASMKNLKLTNLDLSGTQVTDAGLATVSGFSRLFFLNLSDSKVSDQGLSHLRNHPDLTDLTLDKTAVSQLTGLSKLPSIRRLSLRSTKIGMRALTQIATLKSLSSLDLSGTAVTDRQLSRIASVRSLTTLNLSNTTVGDSAMKRLVGLGKLRSLNLDRTRVGNLGLAQIAKLPSLRQLTMRSTKIDDAGLPSVASMKALRVWAIDGTQVTAPGLLKHEMHARVLNVADGQFTKSELAKLKNHFHRVNSRPADAAPLSAASP